MRIVEGMLMLHWAPGSLEGLLAGRWDVLVPISGSYGSSCGIGHIFSSS
jgi:hypothetical protein